MHLESEKISSDGWRDFVYFLQSNKRRDVNSRKRVGHFAALKRILQILILYLNLICDCQVAFALLCFVLLNFFLHLTIIRYIIYLSSDSETAFSRVGSSNFSPFRNNQRQGGRLFRKRLVKISLVRRLRATHCSS